ncbi:MULTISPECIES: aldehyde dehydrogenase family protein [unclassified Novosphingobium]|uniref:aldehyde dehydrogenase family protein n=1 Tax=unclassified Novosphingobium TaxID=2644732 RepID=UPI000869C249|nr:MULTISPECIES: aldehyde dehydrogenase family protein [unclassified Novosphingobium]MDR6707234.1 phenylacetaldehyde dehydrogenase [Novosphingobium sp. 1748]ODU82811.1 MAG: aldehyde dehydrogenase [Novosphingobium sp. SCN 63-17]OJX96516.1 MAG: aldehyde dehydrogenase [Novosphingobium sp. 63-713]
MNVLPFDGHAIAPETAAFLGQQHRLLIDGAWVDGSGEHVTRDPATGLELARFATGGAAEVDAAVAAARRAFHGAWGRMTVSDRTAILFRLARIMEANAQLLTELDIVDNGMPGFIAGLTTANCVEMVDYYAGAVMRIEGTTTAPPRHIAAETEALTYTLREPVGVAGLIVPWNVPLSTAILKLAPALAAGCTVVMKPSEETPLSVLALGQMILDAGFPAGVVNIVNGFGGDCGAALAEHPGVDKISFTGSTVTGKKIVQAALGNLKKVSLELGGKSPVVVMPDADLALAVPGVALATFFLQGQNCMAGTRIFAHEAIHDALVEGVAAFAAGMKLGHGLDPATMQGPMISDAHSAKVMGYIEAGKAAGATLVCGGDKLDRPGNFIPPTIFADCRPDMSIVRDEIFGPVMAVQKFATTDLDEIAELANDTPFGLSGSVWTRDLSTAHRMVKRIRAGHVSINCHGAVGTNIPFGGFGQSGWGREFGREGLDAYLETKAVTARL